MPTSVEEIVSLGDSYWPLRAYRELDDALLHLRINEPELGVVLLRTTGSIDNVLAVDETLTTHDDHWLVREIILHMARVLRRLDLTAKTFFALGEPGSCFGGNLLELALAADRSYFRSGGDQEVTLATGQMNGWLLLPMSNGLCRMQARFINHPSQAIEILKHASRRFGPEEAEKIGLITVAVDDLDWNEEIRVAVQERASFSPDALTGMEASLRFGGPETLDTKIYGRLTAWQNWIFQRPNAVGPRGALTNYGRPDRPQFDYGRT
jgi:benzoyl-CoA-dihydrodiol lyase